MNKATTLLSDKIRRNYLKLLNPLIEGIAGFRIHPNTFTTASFILGCTGGIVMVSGHYRAASALLLLSGILDNIDGNLARKTGKTSKFGALYDSALDRYSETIYFIGLAFFYIKTGGHATAAAAAVALTGSFMVSYIRARAEGLGYSCEIGLIQRPERVVIIGISGLIHIWFLTAGVWIIAVMSNYTAVQRLIHVYKNEISSQKEQGKD